jgi:anti-sigma factor RsiW
MNENQHRDLRDSLGAYVLGQLLPEQAQRVAAHLETCDACRAELDDLVPVAAALSDLRDGLQVSGPVALAVPDDLGDRVLMAVTKEQRRAERLRWSRAASLTGVAAASAVIALLVGVRVIGGDPEPRVPLEAVAITERAPQVRASADLVPHTWGVEVRLRATGFERGERYFATVLGEGGAIYPAGEFVGTGTKEMSCNLNSSVLRERADGFVIRDRAGDVVLASRF